MTEVVEQDGRFLGAPTKDTPIRSKDVVIIYGRQEILAELDERRAGWEGDLEHRQAVTRQQEVVEQQQAEEEQAEEEQAGAGETGTEERGRGGGGD